MYYIVFLAFMLLTSFLLKSNEFQKGKALFYTVYFISMLSVCLFRNNGIYVLILSLPFVAAVGTRRRRKGDWMFDFSASFVLGCVSEAFASGA